MTKLLPTTAVQTGTSRPKGQATFERKTACPKGQVVSIDLESGCPKGQADHGESATCPKGQPKGGVVPKDKAIRPWIKVRLGRADQDVQPIIDGWTHQRKGASNVANAIRLYDAILHGNLDTVREICPLLANLLGTAQNAPADPPVLDSDSVNQISDKGIKDSEGEDVAAAIVEVTGIDYGLNRKDIDKLAGELVGNDYSAADVRRWYSEWWCLKDWRGRDRGERPIIKDVRMLIARVRDLAPLPVAAAQAVVQAADLPSMEEIEADLARMKAASAAAESRPEPVHNSGWIALMMQLTNLLNRATFQEWISRLLLVDVEHGDDGVTYRVMAPDRYVAERVDQHYRPLMEKTLSSFNQKPVRLALTEAA